MEFGVSEAAGICQARHRRGEAVQSRQEVLEGVLPEFLTEDCTVYMQHKTIQGSPENKHCTTDCKTEMIKVEQDWGVLEILQELRDSTNILLLPQASSIETRKPMS